MRSLLDVNVLVALLDPDHIHHALTTRWLSAEIRSGWASCPLTQNGCVRILSQGAYRNSQAPSDVAERLTEATQDETHQFWPDSVSLLDVGRFRWDRVLTSRQITDVYLLSLAVANKGRLVTLDRGISASSVTGATARHLLLLE